MITVHTELALFTFLVNSVIKNGYSISDAYCEVPGSILYLEVIFIEEELFAVLVVLLILAFDHFQELIERNIKQIIPSKPQ